MAISKIGGTASDNWELISSVTPTAATSAVNFTGLSPYRKLLIRWQGIVLTAAGSIVVRVNNDSGSNYDNSWEQDLSGFGLKAESDATGFNYGVSNTNWNGLLELANCDTTNLKNLVNGFATGSATNTIRYINQSGIYRASAIVTQVNLVTSNTFTAVGTVALYGVK